MTHAHGSRVQRGLGMLAGALLLAPTSFGEIRFPAVISRGMVLQQDSMAPIWGWADPGQRIEIRASWTTTRYVGRAQPDGTWRIPIKVPSASTVAGPQTLFISAEKLVHIDDILIGEVWLCSGQSNMEMFVGEVPGQLGGVADWENEVAKSDNPDIRLFDVGNKVSARPLDDCTGEWSRCTPERVRSFSATAYFFGRELNRQLNVPVGLITADWGGTPIQAWTSIEGLRPQQDLKDWVALADRMRDHPAEIKRENDAAVAAWRAELDAKDPGVAGGWAKPEYDDSSWNTMNSPAKWSGELASFDGIVWMRRRFEADAAAAGKACTLDLGPIDDFDETWINGVKVGEHFEVGAHAVNRTYGVPEGVVREGANTVAVRVLDFIADGGMYGAPNSAKLRFEGGPAPIPLAGQWRWNVAAPMASLPSRPSMPQPGPGMPAMLYNGMIAPVVGYGIRGFAWYQGESNRDQAWLYRSMFRAMIEDWRDKWQRRELAFCFVQIAPFGYANDIGQTAELREAQASALLLPHTGMVVTTDIGDAADIHPRNKQEVGHRLALCALAGAYKRALEFSGPVYKSMDVAGDAIRITLDHAEGLAPTDTPLTGFTIAGEDRKFVPAEARLDGQTVVVRSPAVAAPVAVRFAWGTTDAPNLKNRSGLPAAPFRTDDWPGVTQPRAGAPK